MSDRFQIHLQGTSDTNQWLQAEGVLRKLDSAADDFINSLKAGVGIDLGGRLVGGVAQLQGFFTGIIERGYEFNKTMAQSEGGIANVLAKFMNLDEQAAKQEAAKAMAAIMEWEPKAAGSLQDLTLGFMSTVGAGQAAGITVAQNVELVGKFANALAALGMDASQLTQELRAIFTGNITADAQLAKTLQITPQAVQSAKEAGKFYEYLNKQIGKLGDTANGPSVVLSSLQSSIDKAAGALAKGLFDELIAGAEQLTAVLDDPAIKQGLEEVGVSIGSIVKAGAQLSIWAVQNAPLLLKVADAALKVGGAVAAIKLTQIIAGLLIKATRWDAVTTAIVRNTAALVDNNIAASANNSKAVGAGMATSATTAAAASSGTAAGTAMGKSYTSAFERIAKTQVPAVISNLALVAATAYALDAVSKYIEAWAFLEEAKAEANAHLAEQTRRLVGEVDQRTSVATTDEERANALNEALKRRNILLKEAEELRSNPDITSWQKDIREPLVAQLKTVENGIAAIDDLVAKMGTAEGAAEALRKKTLAVEEAEKAFAAAMLEGKAAAGDSAAKIEQATTAVDNLAKKLSEAGGAKLDTSSFESLLKSLEGLDKTKLGEEGAKQVAQLIDLAGKLRDLKAEAAKEAEQQAEKAKKAADDLREAEIKRLELEARAAAAANKDSLSRDLQARADALKLRADLEAQGMSPEAAAGVVKSEQTKDRQKDEDQKRKEQERIDMARQVAELEDQIARHRSEGDKQAEKAAQDRLNALQLARQLEETLHISRAEAEARANQRIADERAASNRDELRRGMGGRDGDVRRPSGPARLSDASTWGDPRLSDGLRGNGGSSIDAFRERQNTPLRDTFQFPALDAFVSSQRPSAPGAADVQNGRDESASANGANLSNAAKQAAAAAAKAREETAKSDAALLSEFERLRHELMSLAEQQTETASQVANNRT